MPPPMSDTVVLSHSIALCFVCVFVQDGQTTCRVSQSESGILESPCLSTRNSVSEHKVDFSTRGVNRICFIGERIELKEAELNCIVRIENAGGNNVSAILYYKTGGTMELTEEA